MAHIKQKCDFCEQPAIYDGKTFYGPWAFMCQAHFDKCGDKTPGLFNVLEEVLQTKKTCPYCHETKQLNEFYRYVDSRGVTRFRTECKECNLKVRKVQRFTKG